MRKSSDQSKPNKRLAEKTLPKKKSVAEKKSMGKGKKKQQTSPEASSEDSSIDFLSRPVTGNTPPLTGGITLPMDPRFLKPGGYNYNVNYNMSDGEGGDDDDDEDDDDDDDEEGDEEEGEDDEEEGESEEEQEEDESDSSSPQPEPSYRKKAGDKKGPKTGKSGTKGNRRESSPQPGPSHRQPSPKRKKPVPKKNLHKETSKTPAKVTGKTPAKGTGKTQAKGTGKTPAKDTGKTPAVKKGSKRKQAQPKRHMSRVLEEIRRLQASDNFLIPRAPFHRVVREIMIKESTFGPHEDWRLTSGALLALQSASEYYLVNLFEDACVATLHRKRVTLDPRDIILVRCLRRDRLDLS